MSLFKNAIVEYYAAQDKAVTDIKFSYYEEWDYTYGEGGYDYSSVSINFDDGSGDYFQDEELIDFLKNLLKWEDTK